MKRIFLLAGALAALGICAIFYFKFGGSPETRRDRFLKKGRDYISQAKVKEAVIEFRNALAADPGSAEGHHELGLALLRIGDYGNAVREFTRASDLKPDLMPPRYQLANLYMLNQDVGRAKEQLNKIQQWDPGSVESHLIAAKIALAEKDYDKAVKEFEEALKIEPKRAIFYVYIGSVYADKKEFHRAEQYYRKALEIDPKVIQARVALPSLYLAMGDQARAEEELILATREDPENETLLHILGTYYARTRKLDEFEKVYLDLLKKKPDSLIAKKKLAEFYILKGDLPKAWSYTHEIQKAQPGDADAGYFYGRLHLAQKEYSRAAGMLFNVTKDAPKFAPAYYYLGLARLGMNDIGQAKAAFAMAKELNPLWIDPRLALARIYLVSGDYTFAWEESEPILKAQPRNFDALMIGGTARLRKGAIDQALDLFRRAKESLPGDANPHINIGAAYVSQKKYSQGLAEYDEALKLDPDRIDALGAAVQVLILQGNQKAALDRVQQHLGKTKNQAQVYQLLGQLSVANKDFHGGIQYLEKAIGLDPNLITAYAILGQAYAEQKMFDNAIGEYQKIVAKNPGAVQALVLLGTLYDMKKEPEKANSYYKKALDLNENASLAANNLAWNYAEHGGNLDIALGLAQKARQIDSENAGIADTLGWIYYKKGAYATAIGLLNESNEKFKGNNPTVLYHLGLAYDKGGDKSRAKESLARALALNQNFPETVDAKKALQSLQIPNAN
jgi:tetratricopeptide (TPR) repeat protein